MQLYGTGVAGLPRPRAPEATPVAGHRLVWGPASHCETHREPPSCRHPDRALPAQLVFPKMEIAFLESSMVAVAQAMGMLLSGEASGLGARAC